MTDAHAVDIGEDETESMEGIPILEHEINNAIFQNTPVGICYVRKRIIIKCNPHFEKLFRYDRQELDGKSVRILYPDDYSYNLIGEKDRSFFKNNDNAFYIAERPMVRKDGTYIWCIISGRIIDRNHPNLGLIWVLQDISDHKNLEEKLKANVEKLETIVAERTAELTKHVNNLNQEIITRKKAEQIANESERKYRMLFNMLPIGISITAQDGQILEANQGFKKLVGKNTRLTNWQKLTGDFFSADGTKISKSNLPWLNKDYQNDHINCVEVGMRIKNDGKRHWLSVSSSILPLQDQQVLVAAFFDITYRKKIEELERLRLAELTRLARIDSTSEMGAALAHQMGQPLVSALNYLLGCQLRLQNVKGVDEICDSVGLAIKHLEQAGQILGRVRDFVSKHKPDKTYANINLLIDDIINFLDFDIRRNNINVKKMLATNLPLVPLCKIEIEQVLFNLLKNSIEAVRGMPSESRIIIVSSELNNKNAIQVKVQDHGEGMEKGIAKQVFEPYFSTKPNGMGIGLTICRSIIESHEGELTYSRAGKKGSIFRFTLPIPQE